MIDLPTIADDEQVPGPGAYRMSMKRYHSQEVCPGPSVSSTGIRMAENVSPWAFWTYFTDKYPKETNTAFSFGSAAHCLLLGDEDFGENYAVLPFDSRRTKEAKAWEQDQIDAGKTVITQSDLEAISALAENLRQVPLVQAGIFTGQAEVSLIWQDEITGLWVKSRPDALQMNGQVIADLKTCASASILDCHRSITKYAYHQQIALAIEGLEKVMGVTATDAVLIFAEKTPPYHVQPIMLDEESLFWGKLQNRRGLDRIARMMETPPLPVYAEDEVVFSLPPSAVQRLTEGMEDGELKA